MSLFENYPLWAALASIFIAQAINIPLNFITSRIWKWGLLFSTGGMPSSHSAAVTGLATAVGITEGFGSTYFALAGIFSIIVMFDAAGVRRHAGEHAALLNILQEEFNMLLEELKFIRTGNDPVKRQKLKELLGHQPIEVLVGGFLGIMIALGLGFFFNIK